MRFSTSVLAFGALLATAVFGLENPILKPDGSSPIIVGKVLDIVWTPTTKGKCKLTLRKGPSDNLKDVMVIKDDIDVDDGHYLWTPDDKLPAGNNYAIMISTPDGQTNYTPLLTIESSVTESDEPETPYGADKPKPKPESKPQPIHKPVYHVPIMKPSYHHPTKTHYNSTTYGNHTTSNQPSTTGNVYPKSTDSPKPNNGGKTKSGSYSPAPETGVAVSSVVRSPLVLVACVLGAIFYLN